MLKVLTKDSVTVSVDAVVFFRVENGSFYVDFNLISTNVVQLQFLLLMLRTRITPPRCWLKQLWETSWEPRIFTRSSVRERASPAACRVSWTREQLPGASWWREWRCKIVWTDQLLIIVFRKDARLPEQLRRTMAAEAEAGRAARAKVSSRDIIWKRPP